MDIDVSDCVFSLSCCCGDLFGSSNIPNTLETSAVAFNERAC